MMYGFTNPYVDNGTYIFFRNSEAGVTHGSEVNGGFIAWQKPSGVKFIHIVAIGGGGAGGYGRTSATGARGGGGGGGGAGITTGSFLASLLPDILYIKPGGGGAPSASEASAGGAGRNTYVSIGYPTETYPLIVAPGGSGGGSTINNVGGAAATAVAALNISSMPFACIGKFDAVGGVVGRVGGTAGADALSGVLLVGTVVSGGTGGGSMNSNAGGSTLWRSGGTTVTYTGDLNVPTSTGAFSSDGPDGYTSFNPFFSTGGIGGGGGGFLAGKGGLGSGGGGGGGGVIGSPGAPGGDGVVIITCV